MKAIVAAAPAPAPAPAPVAPRIALLTMEFDTADDGPVALQEFIAEDPVHKEPRVGDSDAADRSVTHRTVLEDSTAEHPLHEEPVDNDGESEGEDDDQSVKSSDDGGIMKERIATPSAASSSFSGQSRRSRRTKSNFSGWHLNVKREGS